MLGAGRGAIRGPFKWQVIQEVETLNQVCVEPKQVGIQGYMTVNSWLRKYGNFDREITIGSIKMYTR